MSIAAGIVFATTTLVTFTWATLGHQLAAVPAVAKAVAYLDGGFRMPSDAAPRYKRELSCVTEDVGNPPGPAAFVFPADAPLTGWRGWLAGGYNMPTDRDIDAAQPYTLRGKFRGDIPRSHAFGDELPGVARLPNPTGLCG